MGLQDRDWYREEQRQKRTAKAPVKQPQKADRKKNPPDLNAAMVLKILLAIALFTAIAGTLIGR